MKISWRTSTVLFSTLASATLSGPATNAAPPAPSSPVSDVLPAVSTDPITVLANANKQYTQSQRDEAAKRLLSRHTDVAHKVLRDTLISPDIGGELAVARSLEEDADPNTDFIDPLFAAFNNRELATAVGRALAGFKSNPEVLTRLIDYAVRHTTPENTRLAAIRAIGTLPEKRAAATLLGLLESPDENNVIHAEAADALVTMTGLDQNGRDPSRWKDWWDGQRPLSDTDFRQSINAHQEARLDRLTAHLAGLKTEIEAILQDQYRAATPERRNELALKSLQSSEPEIRAIGTSLLLLGAIEGSPPSSEELIQLRDMVADSSPTVRRAAARTISSLNDTASLEALLTQLQTEPDASVKAAIAAALGPMHDLRAVDALLKLLDDNSLPAATAAADALGDLGRGPLGNDATLKLKAAQALRDTVRNRAGQTGSDDLRAACIEAIAPLHEPEIVRELEEDKLLNPSREGKGVRGAMVVAIGELRDPKLADFLVGELNNDSDEDVQRLSILELGKNPAAAQDAQVVGDLLRDPSRRPSVVDAAWQFMVGIFPQLKEGQLLGWAQQFINDPQRRIIVNQVLADKQNAAGHLDDMAITEAQIGDDHLKLKQFDSAAASYKAAMDVYQNQPAREGMRATTNTLEASYMKAMMNGGHFDDAVNFAAERIEADPSEQQTMGPIIVNKADELSSTDPKAAQELLARAAAMKPPLNDKNRERLDRIASQFPRKSSSNDNGAVPQSASVDGKD